jgi:hypothetical protein
MAEEEDVNGREEKAEKGERRAERGELGRVVSALRSSLFPLPNH